MSKTIQVSSKTINGLEFREYVTRADNGVPLDRFSLFRKAHSTDKFTAWTMDTFSQRLRAQRIEFCDSLPDA